MYEDQRFDDEVRIHALFSHYSDQIYVSAFWCFDGKLFAMIYSLSCFIVLSQNIGVRNVSNEGDEVIDIVIGYSWVGKIQVSRNWNFFMLVWIELGTELLRSDKNFFNEIANYSRSSRNQKGIGFDIENFF